MVVNDMFNDYHTEKLINSTNGKFLHIFLCKGGWAKIVNKNS